MGFDWNYPLVMTNIATENHHAIHGKIHHFDWAIFHSYVSHYQTVTGCILQNMCEIW